LPTVLYEVLKVFAVGSSRIGYVVIRKPSLELSLVPFVIS